MLRVHSHWDIHTFSYRSRHVCATRRMADKSEPTVGTHIVDSYSATWFADVKRRPCNGT